MPKNSYWLATKKFRMALKKISLSTCSIFLATSMLTGPPLLAREDSSGRGQISSEIEVAANEEVLLADPNLITAVPITAGAIMEEYHWQTADGPAKAWVTKVDISDPNIELAVIPGQGKLTERLNVTAMAKNTGAVAAINGDFFNTKGEGVPIGPMATGEV